MKKIYFGKRKGGAGSSTTCANVAGILASKGMSVLIVNFDCQPDVANLVLNGQKPAGTIGEVLSGKKRLTDAINDSVRPNLHVISSGDDLDVEISELSRDPDNMNLMIHHILGKIYSFPLDYVFFDCGTYQSPLRTAVMSSADRYVITTTLNGERMDRIVPLAKSGSLIGADSIVVPTQARIYEKFRKNGTSYLSGETTHRNNLEALTQLLFGRSGITLAPFIPYSAHVNASSNARKLLVDNFTESDKFMKAWFAVSEIINTW